MVTEYRYKLEKDSKKHQCPSCYKKRFVRYVDSETGEYLPNQYGRCDREINCGYLLNPYKDGYAKMIRDKEKGQDTSNWRPFQVKHRPKKVVKPKPVFIPKEVLERTLQGYEQNVFLQNLLSQVPFPLEAKDLEKVISLYYLGTVRKGYRKGAVTFPFIDKQGNTRTIQVKQFDKTNHTIGTDFLHTIIEKDHKGKNEPLPDWLQRYLKNELKVSCLFGEHLLSKYPFNPIALVEAPKTAIYSTLYFGLPDQIDKLLWLGVYNLSSLNYNKCKVLQGKDVYLFPDLSKDGKAYAKWSDKAQELEQRMPGTKFIVSDLLEKNANEAERLKGCDLADYLITKDWRDFREESETIPEPEEIAQEPPPEPEPIAKSEKGEKSEASKKTFFSQLEEMPEDQASEFDELEALQKQEAEKWEQEIKELESFFKDRLLPKQPVQLYPGVKVNDASLFIKSHLSIVKHNKGKRSFLPYLERLQKLKKILDIENSCSN